MQFESINCHMYKQTDAHLHPIATIINGASKLANTNDRIESQTVYDIIDYFIKPSGERWNKRIDSLLSHPWDHVYYHAERDHWDMMVAINPMHIYTVFHFLTFSNSKATPPRSYSYLVTLGNKQYDTVGLLTPSEFDSCSNMITEKQSEILRSFKEQNNRERIYRAAIRDWKPV